MNMQQASPVASALANMMQMQKLRQQTAQANVAPQLYGGQAAIAQGVGQQELGAAPYAGPQAAADVGQTAANTAQLLAQAGLNTQTTKQMPNTLMLEYLKLLSQHKLLSGAALGGPKGLATQLQKGINIPNLSPALQQQFYNSTNPNSSDSGNNAPYGLGGNVFTSPSTQLVSPPKNSKFTQNEIYHLNQSGMTPDKINSVYAGNRQLAPDGFIYYKDQNGKLARIPKP